MSIENFLKNFKSFHDFVHTTSSQFCKSQNDLNNHFNNWLKESEEKISFSIRNSENCMIDLFVPQPIKTEVFRDLKNVPVVEISEFDKELNNLKKFVGRRERKRKRIFSEEFKKTSKTESISHKVGLCQSKEFPLIEESAMCSQKTMPTLSKLTTKVMTKNKLDMISEEKGEDFSKEGIENSGGRISEINMIQPEQNHNLLIQDEKVNRQIDAILENFDVVNNQDKENYKYLIQSLKKTLDLGEQDEKRDMLEKKNGGNISSNQNKLPLIFSKNKFDLNNLNQNLVKKDESEETVKKKNTKSIEKQTPNFKIPKPEGSKFCQMTFSKDMPLSSNNKINVINNINVNGLNKIDTTPINKLNKENNANGKIFEMLFNNKDSYSLCEDSPAIDKWNNLGKIFKENYKMNFNIKENGAPSNNNINNIFTQNNNLNISKSLSQKETEMHCSNNINLPKKCFYLSEAENEENKMVMMNNIKNGNFGKVPITGYEITDHSGSGSSTDGNCISENENLKKKIIPKWANDKEYIVKLIKLNKNKSNERRIFGKLKISNLDLNLIFNTNKKSYKNRGESADWKHDNTSSSKLYKEDLKENERIYTENISKNILNFDCKMNEVENNSPNIPKESQIFNNFIENN